MTRQTHLSTAGRRAAAGLVASLLVAALAAAPAWALDPVNETRQGLAIHGYDPVAYFTLGQPTRGLEEHAHDWNGARWLFASAENRAAFVKQPERYAPQYGGYCAKAVSEGNTADIDPEAWDIVDGKLYLNYSKRVRTIWREDIPGRIVRADANWPKLTGR